MKIYKLFGNSIFESNAKLCILYPLFFIIILFCFSCGNSNTLHYGNANLSTKTKHFKKPISRDSSQSVIYIGGSYSTIKDSAYYKNEKFSAGEISAHYAHSDPNFSGAYGVSIFRGNYNVQQAEDYSGDKAFWGYGLSAEFSFGLTHYESFTKSYIRLRPLGMKLSVTDEFGPYAQFRKEAKKEGIIDESVPTGAGLTRTTFFEVDILFNKNHSLGFFYSTSFSINEWLLFSYCLYYEWEKYLLSFQRTYTFRDLDYFSFSLSYRIFDTNKISKK